MRQRFGLALAFAIAAGGLFALGGCGGESKTPDTTPNERQSTKEKMKDPATGKPGSK